MGLFAPSLYTARIRCPPLYETVVVELPKESTTVRFRLGTPAPRTRKLTKPVTLPIDALTVTAPETLTSAASTRTSATPYSSVNADVAPNTAPDPLVMAKLTTELGITPPLAFLYSARIFWPPPNVSVLVVLLSEFTSDRLTTLLPRGESTKLMLPVTVSEVADTVATPETEEPLDRTTTVATPLSSVSAESLSKTTPVPTVTANATRACLTAAPDAVKYVACKV